MARAIQTATFPYIMVLNCLRQVFKLNQFRPHQLDVIMAVLGGKDVLAVMPTGHGKSLCVELPAVLMKGTAIIVSPLLALMNDQFTKNATDRGIHVIRFDSRLKGDDLDRALKGIKGRNQPKIIYVTPERFRSKGFLDVIKDLPISFIAVDEAHCVKDWGFQFRPSYLGIVKVARRLGSPPIVALTATADVSTRDEIIKLLELKDPFVLYLDPDRPEIDFQVQEFFSRKQKLDWLVDTLRAAPGKTIVYVSRRNTTDELVTVLKDHGLEVLRYHAGLENAEREVAEKNFAAGHTPVLVATTAFGMGIDVPDIRLVINFDPPESLEQMMQMAGRAGRDRQPARHVLAYEPHDARALKAVVKSSTPPASYIKWIYETILKFFKEGERRAGGRTRLKSQWFIEGGGKTVDRKLAAQKSSALSLLEAFGLFETDPFNFTLLEDPATVLADFPIKDERLEALRLADLQRLAVIFYYINAPAKDRRRILLEYLRHNSLGDEMEGKSVDDYISIPAQMIEGILRLFVNRDFILTRLILAVRTAGDSAAKRKAAANKPQKSAPKQGKTSKESSKKNASKKGAFHPAHATTIALSSMEGREIKFLVERLVALGFLRWVPIPGGRRTAISITKSGLQWMENTTKNENPAFEPGYESLSGALYHPVVRERIATALERWLASEFQALPTKWANAGNLPDDYEPPRVDITSEKLERFHLVDLIIGGEQVGGDRLLRDYYLVQTRRIWSSSEVLHMLNYYLRERLILAQPAKTESPPQS